MSKNIIQLKNLGTTKLKRYIKGTYYIYYKSDGDLYLYDSYRDVEWNLFRLRAKGKLDINLFKISSLNITFSPSSILPFIFFNKSKILS